MYFFDTNALLNVDLDKEEHFILSSVTLTELENIKTNKNKTEDLRAKARYVTRWLANHEDRFDVEIYSHDDLIRDYGLEITPDTKIIACARVRNSFSKIVFVTNDLCCKNIASRIFKLDVVSLGEENEIEYRGFEEVVLNDEQLANIYNNPQENNWGLLTNEYLIIKNSNGNYVDKLRWDGEQFQPVKIGTLKSDYFGNIKPYNGDTYQQCALNSLVTNKVTMLKGKAGTGKSYLALGYLFHLIEKRKIDKIIIFCNTVATLGSAKLGFYPGSRNEKLLDSQIGNMLSAKLGGDFAVERLVQDNKLVLLPMSDIRGYDTSNMNAGVYITEAQNMDINLMKLALQRIGEDCICIIDGDYNAQVDLDVYGGRNNGMKRMSEVFRGQPFYGEVELQNIYRSKIAEIAELM